MRLLFLGDIIGRSGRAVVLDRLPRLIDELKLDFVIANGENAAGGFGITEDICRKLLDAGIDVVTSGNHVWDQRDALVFIEREPRLLRPVNYPSGTPGKGAGIFTARDGGRVLVVNVIAVITNTTSLETYLIVNSLLFAFFVIFTLIWFIVDRIAHRAVEKENE